MKRSWRIGLSCLLVLCLLTGCGDAKSAQMEKETSEGVKIGFSFYSLVIERWQRDRDVFVSRAEELGATVNTQNASGDLEKQKKQIQYLVDQGMDVIVIIAADSTQLAQSVIKARSAGVKVIAYDRLIENAGVDLYLSFDSEKVGQVMGEKLKTKFPQGANILEVFGSPTDYNVKLMESGLTDALAGSKIKVAEKSYAENWTAEKAFDVVSDYLDLNKKIDAVVCGNDDLAGQAIRALSENQLAGKVYVLGQDGDLAACQRIVEGTQAGTLFKNINQLATQAAEDAVALAKGEAITGVKQISDGTQDVNCQYLTPVYVNVKNLDKVVIDSGFHAKEDVYLNKVSAN